MFTAMRAMVGEKRCRVWHGSRWGGVHDEPKGPRAPCVVLAVLPYRYHHPGIYRPYLAEWDSTLRKGKGANIVACFVRVQRWWWWVAVMPL